MNGLELHPLHDLLEVECADGEHLPYLGFIELILLLEGSSENQPFPCLFLVVPDSKYNSLVPILIGTNILSPVLQGCRQRHGDKFLQVADLHTGYYLAFRSMVLQQKELSRMKGRLCLIRCAESEKVVVGPNSSILLRGYMDKKLPFRDSCAVVQPSRKASFSDLEIMPSIIQYRYRDSPVIDVRVHNTTTRTVLIPPRAVVCELQPVTIEQEAQENFSTDTSHLSEVTISSDLSKEQQEQGRKLLLEYQDIFSKGEDDIGFCPHVKHRIDLIVETPFKIPHRRIPPSMFKEVKQHLKQLLACGIIRRSFSPWASPVVIARKSDGSLRMCVDYRMLNQRTVKDAYALPRTEEIFDRLAGSKMFSVLDMKSGYHQVEIDEEHKPRTAFTVGPLGFYEYNRMGFGLTNSPATYQRLMEDCLGDLHFEICMIFIDDLIIFSDTYEEHVRRLKTVFQRLQENGLKLSPKKCKFFQSEVRYLGHIVSGDGVKPDPSKVDKVMNWPTPESPEQVRQFLGFAGYYRKFIRNFAKIGWPLTNLLPQIGKTERNKKTKVKPTVRWNWGPDQQEAFEGLKTALTTQPVLGYPDYTLPFELHTDACQQGLGAVLYQEQQDGKRVIAYASRVLSKTERNYPAHKLEFLALKWAVTEKFHDYLYGHQFTVLTDNNPLTYVLTSAKLDATGHRWLAALSTYNFSIKYIPGKANTDADGLSRLPAGPAGPAEAKVETISADSIRAISLGVQVPSLVESFCMSSVVVDDVEPDGMASLKQMSFREWRQAQMRDPIINPILQDISQGKRPVRKYASSSQRSALLKEVDHLSIHRGVLHRNILVKGCERRQLVLPSSFINRILKGLHNELGHLGKERTLSLVRERFYFPGMAKAVDAWISACDRCLRRKSPTNARAPLVNIRTTQPLELLCIDYLSLESSKGGFQNILVLTDHFTRYAQAFPTKNQTAKTTAEVLFNQFIVHYGFPQRIHSDQGANFQSGLIKELCHIAGIEKSRTTPYHPMGNGMCERFNRTLLGMLGTLTPDQKTSWKSHVAPLVHAYNCTRHESTGTSPFFLMFGRHPRLPLDIALGLENGEDHRSYTDFVKSLRKRLEDSYRIASEAADHSRAQQKKLYDSRIRGAMIQVGDRVLVRALAFDGKHKLADRWEEDVYIVHSQPNAHVPVFMVEKEKGHGKARTLHRNLLLPIGSLPLPDTDPKKTTKSSDPVKSQTTTDHTEGPLPSVDDSSSDESVEFEHSEWKVDSAGFSATEDTEVVPTEDVLPEETAPVPNIVTVGPGDTLLEEELLPERGVSEEETVLDEDDHVGQVDRVPDDDRQPPMPVMERPPPVPPPRRSLRTRNSPEWIRSGEFSMSQSARSSDCSAPDWREKASFLSSLADAGVFRNMPDSVSKELLSVVMNNSGSK